MMNKRQEVAMHSTASNQPLHCTTSV